jgi:hypothetical protein
MASSKYSNRGSLPAVRRAAVAGVILTAVLSVAVVAHSLGVLKGTAVLLLGVGVAVLLTLTSIITVRMRLRPPTSSTFRRLTYSRPVEVLAGTSVLAVVSMASITVASGVAVHFTLVSAQTPPSPSTGSLSPTPSTGYRPYGPLSQPNLQVDANGPEPASLSPLTPMASPAGSPSRPRMAGAGATPAATASGLRAAKRSATAPPSPTR